MLSVIHESTTPDGLLVDTASGNTWIGADQEYTITSTSTDTENTIVCIPLYYKLILMSHHTSLSLTRPVIFLGKST